MHPKSLWIPLAVLGTLVIGAGTVLVVNSQSQRGQEEAAKEFQQLVGGLGFGPAVDLSRCVFSFDPRLCPGCQENCGPIPGGAYFCPHHACSILYYPPLESIRNDSGETDRNGLLP